MPPKNEQDSRFRLYVGVTFLSFTAGVLSLFLHGFMPFSWISYLCEMYPFFFGVSVLGGLFLLLLKLPRQSFASVAVYWVSAAITTLGCLLLCVLGLFVNPMNWKNYAAYTLSDCIWSPASNLLVVFVSVALAVLILRDLKRARKHRAPGLDS